MSSNTNEIIDFVATLLGDFLSMFVSEIKPEMLGMIPDKEPMMLFGVVALVVAMSTSKILRTSIFGLVGTVIKLGVFLMVAIFVLSMF